MKHFLIFVISFCLLIYILIGSVLYFNQKQFIYIPTITNNVGDWQQEKLDNHTLYLYHQKNHKKVIVIFHGNAGSAINRATYAGLFSKEDVVINEYPGYGLNGDEDVNYKNIIFYAKKTMDRVISEYGQDNIILLGESLGSGVASEMAQDYHISKLILITPYTSLSDLAKRQFFMFPVHWMLKENFDNERALKNYQGNIMMLVSEKDQVIQPKYAFKLYRTINTQKHLILIKNAGHNDWMSFISQEQLESIEQFNHS